jgi:uncharacterized protein (TIGR03382 family)
LYTFLVKLTDRHGRQDIRSLSIKLRNDYQPKGGCATGAVGPEVILSLMALLAVRRRRGAGAGTPRGNA